MSRKIIKNLELLSEVSYSYKPTKLVVNKLSGIDISNSLILPKINETDTNRNSNYCDVRSIWSQILSHYLCNCHQF